MLRAMLRLGLLSGFAGALLLAHSPAHAGPIIDPAGDFRARNAADANAYRGLENGALDILSANVILDLFHQTVTFTATTNGQVASLVGAGNSNLGTYIWGINHGYATNNFAAIGAAGVVFDAVLTINPNGTASYRGTNAPAGSVTISGSTITGVFSTAFIAPPPPPASPNGPLLDITQWGYNLWPRSLVDLQGAALAGNAAISDFAPDNSTFRAELATPEPSTFALAGLGLLGAAGARIRARRRA